MSRPNERGMALLMALFMTMIVSALAVALVQVARSETLSSHSYRTTTQARYAAESGLASAANYLLSSQYEAQAPGTAGDPLTNYNVNVSPVTAGANPVVLSTTANQSNYPVAAVVQAFQTAATGTLTQGIGTVEYSARARLLAMRQITDTLGGGTRVVQTWEITGTGRLGGSASSEVEVSAIVERHTVPTFRYAAFSTNNGCDSLTISGGAHTNSYDSSAPLVGGNPVYSNSGGDVGTNGNLDIGGSGTVVNGTLSTPRTGVGNCTAANVTAMTVQGHAQVTGGLVELPQEVTWPAPPAIDPLPPTTTVTMGSSFSCGSVPAGCSKSGSTITLTPAGATPYTLGNVSVTSGQTLVLSAGTYVVNSISVSGTASIATLGNGPVIIRVAGESLSGAAAISLNGNSVSNPGLDPTDFQLIYGGTADVRVAGGSAAAALVYAPRANVTVTGNADFFGAIVGGRVNMPGGARLHYDRNLANTAVTTGNPVMTGFTWRSF